MVYPFLFCFSIHAGQCIPCSNKKKMINVLSFSMFKIKRMDETKTKKVKRSDVSLRRKNRLLIEERTVIGSLPKRLGCQLHESIRSLLQEEIDSWVLTVSKITHRLSIMFNRLLLHIMKNKLPLPCFNDSFFNALALHGMKKNQKNSKLPFVSLIDDFCSNHFGEFPTIQRNRGDCQAILIASSRYKVNFLNSLHVPFFSRQEKFIRTWLNVQGISLSKTERNRVRCEINGWTRKKSEVELSQNVLDFIFQQRQLLKTPKDGIHEKWLENNPLIVLSYYFFILEFYTQHDTGNKFRMAPLCQIKSHFLSVDNTVLLELMKNVIKKADEEQVLFPDWIREKIAKKEIDDLLWKAIFNNDGLRRQMRFSNRVDTDGTRACFHFQVTKKKQKKREKNRRKKRNQPSPRVISIDPGRVNLITAYDHDKDRYYKLTRRYYYRATGMKARVQRNNERNLRLKDVYEAMSQSPTKSIQTSDWRRYQCLVTEHYDRLWCFNASEENRRENFRALRSKQKCLDRFLNQFQGKGERKPVIAYGGATMNPTGKGELSVPVKYIYKKCSERYTTRKVDEKYSTLMHFKCQKTTIAVRKESEYTRGLRWCPTCRELVSRDKNACKNIGLVFESEERPKYLCDTYDRDKKKEYFDLVPKKVNSHTPTITEGTNVPLTIE